MSQFLIHKGERRLKFLSLALSLMFVTVTAFPALSVLAVPAQPLLDASEEIVYLSNEGQIMVLDPVSTGAKPITWSSVEKGFYNFALGDFNNDGDKEIVAINQTTKQMVIYDPVVTKGPNDGQIGDVPWRKLLTRTVNGTPNVIAVGNFDVGVPGDEIAIGFETGGSPAYVVEILKAKSQTPDGTALDVHARREFANIWRDSSVGDVVSTLNNADDLVLIDYPSARVSVFQMDNGFADTNCAYGPRSDGARPTDAVVLQWNAGGAAELAIVREWPADGAVTQPRLFVFACVNNSFEERFSTKYNPTPYKAFKADVTNNGDDELFLIRDLQASDVRDRIFTENPSGDTIDFHSPLESDNGFRGAASGDTDGNDSNKDEVVLMRNNKIRIYREPERGADSVAPANYQDYALNTNNYSIEVGDLDKNGYTIGYSLVADVTSLSATVSAGDKLTDAGLFRVSLSPNDTSKQHDTPTVTGIPSDIKFAFRAIADSGSIGFTPTQYLFDVDATNATNPRPGQPYVGRIEVTSNEPKVEPLSIPFTLTLNYARLEFQPAPLAFVYYPCEEPLQPMTQTVKVLGTPGVTFGTDASVAAANADLASWLSISPTNGTVGDTLQFSIDPTKWTPHTFAQTTAVFFGDERTGATAAERLREVEVSVICATSQIHLPIIAR